MRGCTELYVVTVFPQNSLGLYLPANMYMYMFNVINLDEIQTKTHHCKKDSCFQEEQVSYRSILQVNR